MLTQAMNLHGGDLALPLKWSENEEGVLTQDTDNIEVSGPMDKLKVSVQAYRTPCPSSKRWVSIIWGAREKLALVTMSVVWLAILRDLCVFF